MNNIFLFPGQGSQSVGMGKDLSLAFQVARLRYEEANEILGFDFSAVCFEGTEDELRQTRVTQPALYVHSCVLTDLLSERDLRSNAAAGHSLGEYSALYAAGTFSFAEGLKLVKVRAEAMQMAGETNPGTMAAIVGLDDAAVSELCREISGDGVVVPANFNSPGQLVISGNVSAVRKAVEVARAKGAKLAKELPVSGAFHSPLMRPAAEALRAALSKAELTTPRMTVVSNVTARPHENVTTMRGLLADQLLSPVRWTESIQELDRVGEARWFEVGSGTVLGGLLKRTIKGTAALSVGTVEGLEKITSILSET